MVPSPLWPGVIDLARNQTRVIQAGARTIPMESNDLTLARVTGGPSGTWVVENEKAPFSSMSFGAYRLQSRTLTCMLKSSIELIEDAPNAGDVLRTGLAACLAAELDRAFLRGTGAGAEPLGLRNWAGISTIDMGVNGAALTNYDRFSLAVQKIAEANGPDTGLSLIYAPRTAGEVDRLKNTQNDPMRPPESWGRIGKFSTNQVPTNLTHGSANNATEAYVGVFPEMLIGVRTQLVIEATRVASQGDDSAFTQRQVWLRGYLRADCILTRPSWFTLVKGIIPPV
jgi:HK97 family phage major capsid protein